MPKSTLETILADQRLRIEACRQSKFLFGIYYLSHYVTHQSPQFHKDMASDLDFNGFDFLLWIMFREGAKTTWAKIAALHAICYKTKRNIGWAGFDLAKAKRQIRSIANELQGNKKIIRDFGQLFFEDLKEMDKSKPKMIGEFMTENGVACKALSTKVSTRGDIVDQFRPDFYILDDIENYKTARSTALTRQIQDFIDELVSGKPVNCDILVLANRISKNGTIAWLEKKMEGNPRARKREVAVEEGGVIVWPGKYVATNAEAQVVNAAIADRQCHYISLEQRRRDLGTPLYNQEFLLKPQDIYNGIFKVEWFRRVPMPSLENMDFVIHADPAISEKATADYFAIAVLGRERTTKKMYLLQSLKTRCNVMEQMNLITNTWRVYPGAMVSIESVAYQLALAQIISNPNLGGIYIPKTSVKTVTPTKDKVLRAQAVLPYIERGDVLFTTGTGVDELVADMVDFPFGDHDDTTDAAIGAIEYFTTPQLEPGLSVF